MYIINIYLYIYIYTFLITTLYAYRMGNTGMGRQRTVSQTKSCGVLDYVVV